VVQIECTSITANSGPSVTDDDDSVAHTKAVHREKAPVGLTWQWSTMENSPRSPRHWVTLQTIASTTA
jgi:hypothetical protein